MEKASPGPRTHTDGPLLGGVRVDAGSTVDLSIEDGELVIRPVRRRYRLRSLVAQISPDNVHGEIDWGEPVGRESW